MISTPSATRWELVSIDGEDQLGKSDVYFTIDGDGVEGYDGCNRFAGLLSEIERMRGTQRGCPPEVFQIRLVKAKKELLALDPSRETVTLRVGLNGEAVTFRRVEHRSPP